MLTVCSACAAKNRVDPALVGQSGKAIHCGRCGKALLDGHPVELHDGNFQSFIGGHEGAVVVDFWAPWCAPCRMMAPQFEQAAGAMPQVVFAKLNTQDHPQTGAALGIRGIPTLVLYRAGREVARISGAMPAAELQAWVKQELARAQ